jgi:glycosyltransferase involved in cell wall biosynthesis
LPLRNSLSESQDSFVKKLLVNGKFFCQRITGTQRYARELLTQFDKLISSAEGGRLEIEILVPRCAQAVPRYENLQVRRVGRWRGTLWEQIELPRYCAGQMLFTPCGGAPVLHPRNVVTIHDAAVFAAPAGYSLAYRLWYRSVCRRMGHTAKHIFTVSNFSKAEIVKWYGAAPENITVTYLGGEHFSCLEPDASALARFGIGGKYILAVSSQNPNKNFERIVEATRQLKIPGLQLVIAGGADRIYRSKMKAPDGVRSLGYVSDPELKALFGKAECFVFASLYEGFGLPPLEALSSGCSVVLSRAGSLPEIFQGAGVFCDPYDLSDIADAIRRTIQSPVTSGDERRAFACRFSWEKCARQTLDVLKDLC